MKSLVRNILFYIFSLFILTQILEGVKIYGGVTTYIIGAVVLTLMFWILKPILSIITFPLNFLTLGLFSFLINTVILYLLTVFVPNISIRAFVFNGASFAGFIIPKVFLNTFFAFVAASILLSFIVGFLTWLTKK